MNNTGRWIALVAALVLAAGVGVMAYNAGVAHGIEQSGKIVAPAAPPPGPGPYPYPYYYGWHPWHFGFFFGPLFFFFFIFLFFAIVRGLFWRGRYGWHHHHGCGYRPADEGGAPQQ